MWNWNMKSFSIETLIFFFRKFWVSIILDLAKTVWALWILSQKSTRRIYDESALSTGKPWTCEYVTLLQWFHRGTLNKHCYIARNFWPTFFMSILFRQSFKATIFRRILKVFHSKVSCGFLRQDSWCGERFHISIIKELSASKKQISWLVYTYSRFQGNLFEIVEIMKIPN